jgi:hypothetical protein
VAVRFWELCEQPVEERVRELRPGLDRTVERFQEDGDRVVFCNLTYTR